MWNFPFKSSFKLRKNPTAVGVVRLCIKEYDSVCCGTIYKYDDMAVSEGKAFDVSWKGTILQVRRDSEVVKLWNVFCKWVFNIPISLFTVQSPLGIHGIWKSLVMSHVR